MQLRLIGNNREYRSALKEIEVPWSAPPGLAQAGGLDVLNRVRSLTLEMIRRLAAGLKLPADVLFHGYELKRAA